MPDVSKIIKSKLAPLSISTADCTYFDKAKLDCLVASERIKTRLVLMAFIRILSPNKAPPVFRFEGSTETMAMVLSSKSIKKRRTNSSTRLDLPAPPVPVMPTIGVLSFEFCVLSEVRNSVNQASFCSG